MKRFAGAGLAMLVGTLAALLAAGPAQAWREGSWSPKFYPDTPPRVMDRGGGYGRVVPGPPAEAPHGHGKGGHGGHIGHQHGPGHQLWVWVPANWHWNGYRWVLVPGHWAAAW